MSQKLYHPDIFRNPSLAPDKRVWLDILAMRAMLKLRELSSVPEQDRNKVKIYEVLSGIFRGHPEFSESNLDRWMTTITSSIKESKSIAIARTHSMANTCHKFDGKILKVNPEFFKALGKCEVNFKHITIPNGRYYVQLQKGVMYLQNSVDLKTETIGAYVTISDDTILISGVCDWQLADAGILFSLQVPRVADTFQECFDTSIDSRKFICSDKRAEEMQEDVLKHAKENMRILQGFLNTCIYSESLNPDVSEFRPIRDARERKKFVGNRRYLEEHISSYFNVSLLNWSYGQERTYSVDSTFVDSYLRWQRCGPGMTQIKLIMVSEHERHYKNVVKPQQEENRV